MDRDSIEKSEKRKIAQAKAKRYQREGSLMDMRHAEVRLFCIPAMLTPAVDVTKFKEEVET